MIGYRRGVKFQNVRWDLEKGGRQLISFILKSITGKYLSQKRGEVHWICRFAKSFWYSSETDFMIETGVVLNSRGKWEERKIVIRGEIRFNIYVARALNIEDRVLEQIYNSLTESYMMTRVEICGLEGNREFHELVCKRIMGMPSTVANGICARELGRIDRMEKVTEFLNTGKYCGKWIR
jgi:hypothetical protein